MSSSSSSSSSSRSAGTLGQQKDAYETGSALAHAGVDAEEAGDLTRAFEMYLEAAGIFQSGLAMSFAPQDREAARPLHGRMTNTLSMIVGRMEEIAPSVSDAHKTGSGSPVAAVAAAEAAAAAAGTAAGVGGASSGWWSKLFGKPVQPAQPAQAPPPSSSAAVDPNAVVNTAAKPKPKPKHKRKSQFDRPPPSLRGPTTVRSTATRRAGARTTRTARGRAGRGRSAAGRGRSAAGRGRSAAGAGPSSSAGGPPIKGVDPAMQELILNEVVDSGSSVAWDDIIGLQAAKQALQEMVILPALNPELFTGLRSPPKGLLLFGPPGNGKTMLAKAAASQAGLTFFAISASSLTSKYVGESEKLVRALFAVARTRQPAIIFIDEIDSLLSARKADEHEASRRLKTEFLVQLDGATTASDDRIVVMAATNRPEDIDDAARRRFVKRIYISLPDKAARKAMILKLLEGNEVSITNAQLGKIATATDGFSGADIAALCRDAALGPVRELGMAVRNLDPSQIRPISNADFKAALKHVRPSVSRDSLAAYEAWNADFGSASL